MKRTSMTYCAILIACNLPLSAFAQKGTGDAEGVARQADKPPIVTVEGVVKEVSTHPCELTTGKGIIGTHLILKHNDRTINLHLGPASQVKDIVAEVKAGSSVTARAFRTQDMPEQHYNAIDVKSGKQTFTLRDESLRPRWAGRGLGRQSRQSAGSVDAQKATDDQIVVMHLSHFTDDLHRCFMALKMAGLMQEFGADVTLFLDLEGVRLAERRQTLDMTWGSGATPLIEFYNAFTDGGGRVLLCPHCAKSARLGDLGLKRNAQIATLPELGKLLISADKVLDY